jgi:HSP20 family molecular chaperone IbpA
MAQDKASSSGGKNNAQQGQQGQSGARQSQPGSQQSASQQRSDMNPGVAGSQQGSSARSGAQQGSSPSAREWSSPSQGDISSAGGSATQDDRAALGRGQDRDFDAPSRYASGGLAGPFYGRGYPRGLFTSMRRFSEDMDRLFDAFVGGHPLWSSFDRGSEEDDDLGGSRRAQSGFGQLGDYNRTGSQGQQESSATQSQYPSPWSGQRRASSRNMPSPYAGTGSMWAPHIEMYERDGKIVVTADLPGMKKSDVNVELHHDHVVIQGERRNEQTSNERGFYRTERSYGSFYRSIPLPEGVDGDSAKAAFQDGVLRIEMQAPEQKKSRRLDISDTSGTSGGTESNEGSGSSAAGRKGTSGSSSS